MRFGKGARKVFFIAAFFTVLYVYKNDLLTKLGGGGAPAAAKPEGCQNEPGGSRTTYLDIKTAGCMPCSVCGDRGLVAARPCGPLEDATCAESCLSTDEFLNARTGACVQCSFCAEGLVTLQRCSPSADTVCGAVSDGGFHDTGDRQAEAEALVGKGTLPPTAMPPASR